MKRFVTPVAAVALVLGLQACDQQQSGDSAAGNEPVALDTPTKRLSYGVALGLGRNMKNDGMEMDIDAFALGLRDAFSGAEQRLSQEEIQAEMMAFQEKLQAEQEANQEAQASANADAAQAFLAENGAREEVTVTDSGLQYEVIEAGEGPVPGSGDSVEVHYRGTLLDGTEFDSSYERGQPVTFGVDQVIAGWTEALQLMPIGSKWKLYIPPELAYGAGGAGNVIGPNAALTFEVELLSIPSQEEEAAGEDAPAEG
ncbi:FKBP-type peptidyl-prolyl cis-trans isomerase [Pseudohaliea rubra]|uniref:Peptidyl-prolyl cis-trans isomerase n=1 Tax=Pseudohaliea rubra DSM 19751 TaxID=1265313 RepID=A0A095VSH0_9GAMM|nr:FKBP-type peptidyl-prolyl cis-trans isomerase [Pseudohaliea rubra]KGE04028.1 FKBP-type peptidyl-prolyl cis-trans isomerase [Pseudohaliea rubra DSM 19751]